MATNITVDIRGNFFRGDAGKAMEHAVNDAIYDLVKDGERRLEETLVMRPQGVYLSIAQAGKKHSQGHYLGNVGSEIGHLNALISDGGVLYGPWLEGTSSRNQTTRFKGYASFRKTRDWMDKRKRATLEKHVKKWVRRMGR